MINFDDDDRSNARFIFVILISIVVCVLSFMGWADMRAVRKSTLEWQVNKTAEIQSLILLTYSACGVERPNEPSPNP